MSRLYDRIMVDKPEARPYFHQFTVIEGSGCLDYAFTTMREQYTEITALPCVTPPFGFTFVEFKRRPQDLWEPHNGLPYSWGITCVRYSDMNAVAKEYAAQYSLPVADKKRLFETFQANRWYLLCGIHIEVYKHDPAQFVAICNFLLDDTGAITRVAPPYIGRGTYFYDAGAYHLQAKQEGISVENYCERYAPELVGPLLTPFWAVMSLINCKNIQLVDNPPPPALSKAHQKKTGEPLVTYKTIKVNPMRTVKHVTDLDMQHAPHTPSSADMPLSIWRGHFKDYRDGKGLFGNPTLKGVYWWDQHVRGSIDNGITIKDYAVQAPRKDSDS